MYMSPPSGGLSVAPGSAGGDGHVFCMADCPRCDDYRWVCENHPDKPWEGPRACDCGGAGAPCPACNASEVTMPEMPDDFFEDRIIPRGKYVGRPVGDDGHDNGPF